MRSTQFVTTFAIAALASAGVAAQETQPVQGADAPVEAVQEPQSDPYQPEDLFALSLLQSHNKARAEVNAAPLRWNDDLAKDAAEYAAVLAAKNKIEHSKPEDRDNAGENLWIGTTGYYSTTAMMDAFLTEKAMFKPGIFPDVSTTGNWFHVGHYTQIIWKDTQEVGCAIADNPQSDVLVCRYQPPGNWRGTPMP